MTQLTTKSSIVRAIRRVLPGNNNNNNSSTSTTTSSTSNAPQPTTGGGGGAGTWEWSDDEGNYNSFDAEGQSVLEKAFSSGLKKIEKVKLRNAFYTFDLVALTQTNIGTGFVRAIKRTAPPGKWQFKDTNQTNWTDYDTTSNRLIEATFTRGAGKVVLNHQKYCNSKGGFEIDFSGLLEIEKCSGASKQVQRVPPPTSHSIYGKTVGYEFD